VFRLEGRVKFGLPWLGQAVRSGRCWLRVRCRCAALQVLLHWLCLIAVRKAFLLSDPLLCFS
jgi:hypothetical protein